MRNLIIASLMSVFLMTPTFANVNVEPLTQEQILILSKFSYDYEGTFNNLLVNENGEMKEYEYVNHPNMAIKQFEINKILVAYALKHGLYAHVSYTYGEFGYASLYRCIEDYERKDEPFFEFSFRDDELKYLDDREYSLFVTVNSLHNFNRMPNESRADAKARLEAMNYESQYIVDALKDSLMVLFEDDTELVTDSIVMNYHETINKYFYDTLVENVKIHEYMARLSSNTNCITMYFEYDFEDGKKNE